MTKNRFDLRTIEEIVGDLVIERTSFGDTIHLEITYNGVSKPTLVLKFSTLDPEKAHHPSSEDLSDWLPETPYYFVIDDSTGKPVEGELQRGYPDWRSYFNDGNGLGPGLKRICNSGGRIFTYQEL